MKPREQLADAGAVPQRHVRGRQASLMADTVERRRRLGRQEASDSAQRDLDGIRFRARLPESSIEVAERGEPAGVVERVEQVAETRAVAAEVLLHRVSGAEAGVGGVESFDVGNDDLPFMRWRKLCCCACFIGVMFRVSQEIR